MIRVQRIPRLVGVLAVALLCASLGNAQILSSPDSLPTTRHAPDEFGTQDYTVTTITAMSFTPMSDDPARTPYYYTTPGIAARGFLNPLNDLECLPSGQVGDLVATATVPSGAVIDYVGLQTSSPSAFDWGVDLRRIAPDGSHIVIATFSSTAHGFGTDYNATALGFQLTQNVHNALVLTVEEGGDNSGCPLFSWVEIWWKRVVSPPPGTPTFNDVAPGDFGFQYIEALAASGITGGCGGGNYCPNANLTRAQMAVFLAKALGLHWPN